jgi:hypothetical protein
MDFYHKLLGGTLERQTINQQGVLKPAGPGSNTGDHMALALAGTDRIRLSKIFNDLADGGKIKGPPTRQSGGGEVGWLVDKFGPELDGQYRYGIAPPSQREADLLAVRFSGFAGCRPDAHR